MLSIKETKSGGVAIIFSKEYAHLAKSIYPSLATKAFSNGEELGIPDTPKRKSLSDIKREVETAKHNKGLPENIKPKLMLNIPKTTIGIPKDEKEVRQSIHELVNELCTSQGLKYGIAWNKAYRLLYDATGFDVEAENIVRKKGQPSKIDTVLKNGRGGDLIRVLRSFLDRR